MDRDVYGCSKYSSSIWRERDKIILKSIDVVVLLLVIHFG